jgi:hypothetical protein
MLSALSWSWVLAMSLVYNFLLWTSAQNDCFVGQQYAISPGECITHIQLSNTCAAMQTSNSNNWEQPVDRQLSYVLYYDHNGHGKTEYFNWKSSLETYDPLLFIYGGSTLPGYIVGLLLIDKLTTWTQYADASVTLLHLYPLRISARLCLYKQTGPSHKPPLTPYKSLPIHTSDYLPGQAKKKGKPLPG